MQESGVRDLVFIEGCKLLALGMRFNMAPDSDVFLLALSLNLTAMVRAP